MKAPACPIFQSSFFLILFLSAITMTVNASPWQEAEKAYNEGRYLQAASIYEQAVPADSSGWAALYNCANAYYKAGYLPQALRLYWQAFFANPRHPDVAHNLKMAASVAGDVLAPSGVPEALYRAWRFLNPREWTVLTLGFWWVLAFCAWLLYWMAQKLSRTAYGRLKIAIWISGLGFIFSLGVLASQLWADRRRWTILDTPGLLRSGPSVNLPVTAQIPEGRFVWILEEREGWQRVISRKEGLTGWIK